MELTGRRLRELIIYLPVTGEFFRLDWRPARQCVKENGKRYLTLDGKRYVASKIAWLWMRGILPPFQISHINGIDDDDRWRNLRPMRDHFIFKGVRYEGMNQWSARICVLGKIHPLGIFRSPHEARAAYREAMKNHLQYVPSKVLKKWAKEPRFG
jgi:hypothetical protein